MMSLCTEKQKRSLSKLEHVKKKKKQNSVAFLYAWDKQSESKIKQKIMAEKDIKNHKNAFLTAPEIITALY